MSVLKNVLLSGPGRGLGLAIARRLVCEGYRVLGVGRHLTPEFSALMESDGPGEASFYQFDLLDLDGIASLVSRISNVNGPIYALVNNSGIGLDGVLATMHGTDISKVLRLNLEAPILLAKYACRPMLAQKEGRIVNISSIIASTGFNGLSVYAATKGGLEAFSRSLSRELGRAGITVNCVAPGYMETDMTANLVGEKLESVRRRAPLGLPEVQDVAAAVAYLLSDDARRMTGTVVTVDGGSTA